MVSPNSWQLTEESEEEKHTLLQGEDEKNRSAKIDEENLIKVLIHIHDQSLNYVCKIDLMYWN